MSNAPITATITNLGKYCAGDLVCRDLDFPTTTEAVQECLRSIGVDGINYEEIMISEYTTTISGLYNVLGEYEHLDELNYFAALVSEMDQGELDKLGAAIECSEVRDLAGVINLVDNLDCYEFYPDIDSEQAYGEYLIDECGALEIPHSLQGYIDYEAYGRDVMMDETSRFVNGGYVCYGGGATEYYHDRDDIPDRHRVFAYPVPESIKQHRARETAPPEAEHVRG